MHDTRACHELPRPALIERVARALREPEIMADPRIPPGRCALCLESLPRSYHVTDMREGRVSSWDVAPGTREEAAALKLKVEHAGEVWLSPVKLCYCAESPEIQHAAVLHNRERMKPKAAPAAPPSSFGGGSRY